LITAVNTQ